MTRGWWAAGAVVLWLGCGGGGAVSKSATTPGAAEPTGPSRPQSQREAFLQAGVSSSEEGARAEALHRLDVALYGSEAWARFLREGVATAPPDPAVATEGDAIRAGLSRAEVEARLRTLPERELSLQAPADVRPVLEAALRVHLARLACERRRELLDAECELPDTEVVDADLRALSMSLMLEARYEGGVPLGEGGRPLRPATVVVRRVAQGGGTEPVGGLPLRAELVGADEARSDMLTRSRATTGEAGEAAFPVREGAPWPGTLRVAVAAERWLGPLSRLWAGEPITLEGRPTGLERWAMLATERVRGAGAREGVVARQLARTMRERGAGGPVSLGRDQRSRLDSAVAHERLERVVPNVADELAGKLDVLMVVDVDSEFASRMGANRVWYEARGRLRVVDAWTGRGLAAVQASVTEAGVGDRRADRAARQRLAEELVRKLFDAVKSDPVAHAK